MSIRTKLNLLSSAFILVMLASWFLNFGWLRLALTFALAPIVHSVIFFLGNNFSSKVITGNKTVKQITIVSYITFLLPHLLILDTGDIGEPYILFHLIENSTIASICTHIGVVMLIIHIASLLAQYIFYFRLRKKVNLK